VTLSEIQDLWRISQDIWPTLSDLSEDGNCLYLQGQVITLLLALSHIEGEGTNILRNRTIYQSTPEKVTSVHILCECETLATLKYTYLGFFILDSEDIRVLGRGVVSNFAKGTGLL
jgi:hypothetical protein